MPHSPRLASRGVESYAAIVFFTLLAGDAWRNSISWLGWGVLLSVLAVVGGAMLWARRAAIRPGGFPYPLLAFLILATASVAWSAYPGWTGLGAAAQWITTAGAALLALILDWRGLLLALRRALKAILALSLLFELFVSVIVRHPVLPFWTDWQLNEVPLMYQWSRMKLFEGGPIQGIVGNSSTLGFLALLATIVITISWFDSADDRAPADERRAGPHTRRMRAFRNGIWLVLALLVMALSASATIALAGVAVLAAVGLVHVMRRTPTGPRRSAAYAVAAAVIAAAVVMGVLLRATILGLLGKSSDLTGRLDIWQAVASLIDQRPAFGWGWVSYWVPWVEPFDGLVVRNDTEQLHAHNAWLDVTFQLGFVGLIVFAALVLSTLTRSWFIALDGGAADWRGDRVLSMLPLLLLTALLVQSLAESRLLLEYGWLLLAYISFATRRPSNSPLSIDREMLAVPPR